MHTHLIQQMHVQKPRCLILDLTKRCNMRCPGCIFLLYDQDYFSNEDMEIEQAKKLIQHYAQDSIKELYLTAEGEIFLYHDVIELSEFSRNLGFEKIHLNTNGYLLDKYIDSVIENIDSLYISLDGYDRQSYKKHRGIDAYEQVINNIKTLILARQKSNKKIQVSLACVIYEEKLFSIEKMIRLAEHLKVDRLEFYNFHNPILSQDTYGFSALTQKTNDLYDHYQKIISNNNYTIEIVLPSPLNSKQDSFHCENLFNYITIGARGDFTPCCRIPPNSMYGNAHEDSNAYHSGKIQEFKENLLNSTSINDLSESCQKCQGLSSKTYIYNPHTKTWKKRWLVTSNISASEDLDLEKELENNTVINWSTILVHNTEHQHLLDELEAKENVIQTQHKVLQEQQKQLIEKENVIQTQHKVLQEQQKQLTEKENVIQTQCKN